MTLPKRNLLKNGIIWNIISYGVMGGMTLLLYIFIGNYYGQDKLGHYSLLLTLFGILGQIGVFGQQVAIVYKEAQNMDDMGRAASAMLTVSLAVGGIVAGITFWLTPHISDIMFHTVEARDYIYILSPAIVLFSVNKFLLGILNAKKCMVTYACLQMLRYVVLIITAFFCIKRTLPFESIAYSFIISEICVFSLAGIMVMRKETFQFPNWSNIKEALLFGGKAMLGGVLGEFNTRIDLLMLGALAPSEDVGIYSYISLITVGIMGGLNVFFVNYNPYFAEGFAKKDKDMLIQKIRSIRQKATLFVLFGSVAVVMGYYLLCVLFLTEEYRVSVVALIIVLAGVSIMSPMHICRNVCTQAGKPMLDTRVTIGTMIMNLILNYLAIPLWGILGAASATCISFISFATVTGHNIKKVIASMGDSN